MKNTFYLKNWSQSSFGYHSWCIVSVNENRIKRVKTVGSDRFSHLPDLQRGRGVNNKFCFELIDLDKCLAQPFDSSQSNNPEPMVVSFAVLSDKWKFYYTKTEVCRASHREKIPFTWDHIVRSKSGLSLTVTWFWWISQMFVNPKFKSNCVNFCSLNGCTT